jgi:hypothetical protein
MSPMTRYKEIKREHENNDTKTKREKTIIKNPKLKRWFCVFDIKWVQKYFDFFSNY